MTSQSYRPVCIPVQHQPVYATSALLPVTAPAAAPGSAYTLPLTHPTAIHRLANEFQQPAHKSHVWLWWLVGALVVLLVLGFLWNSVYRGRSIRATGNPTPAPPQNTQRPARSPVNRSQNGAPASSVRITAVKQATPPETVTIREIGATDPQFAPNVAAPSTQNISQPAVVLPTYVVYEQKPASHEVEQSSQNMQSIRDRAKTIRQQKLVANARSKQTCTTKVPRYWSNARSGEKKEI